MVIIRNTERVKICKDKEISVIRILCSDCGKEIGYYVDEEHIYEEDKSDGIIPDGLYCDICGQEICDDCASIINYQHICKQCVLLNEKYSNEIEKCEKKKREMNNDIHRLNYEWKKESLKNRKVE